MCGEYICWFRCTSDPRVDYQEQSLITSEEIDFGGFIMVFIRFMLGLLEGVGHAIGYAKH